MLKAGYAGSLTGNVSQSERAMNYKLSCPACGKRVSRWLAFSEPIIFHRCRGCGIHFPTSWTATFVVVAIEIGWLVLERMRIISPWVAIGLVLLTCVLAIWLLPYFSPTILKDQPEAENR